MTNGAYWFNPTSFSPAHAAQMQYALALHAQGNPAALQQLSYLNQISSQDALLRGGYGQQGPYSQGFAAGPCGCIPSPQINFSGAPAGRGLTKSPEGWPAGAVQTAGGYTVVPEGRDAAFSVYGPGAKPGDQPITRVWGDPHVNEKDGTRWDFTKNSNFRLPDGTNIGVTTTSQTGQSVTSALDITNGADRVQISGINSNSPTTGDITHDGYQARAHLSNGTDTYHLGGDATNQRWFLERDGRMQGEVTGAHYDRTTNRYEQDLNRDSQFSVDPSLRPPFGSPAWGNQLRMEAVDIARRSGNHDFAHNMGNLMHADHVHGALTHALGYDPTMIFGGYGGWGGFPQQQLDVGSLFQVLAFQEAQNQYLAYGRGGAPIMV
jgi:hypothetical protein